MKTQTRLPTFGLSLLALLAAPAAVAQPARELELILVQGAAGTEEFATVFDRQAAFWQEAAAKAGATLTRLGHGAEADDLPALETALQKAVQPDRGQLWLVLIGHGTYDGREAKFNLRGPDLTPAWLAERLKPLRRELILVHTGSASGGFLKPLAGPRRTIVTATKGGDEVFYARFGEHFAPAITGLPEADLDQDRQVSVLEAFLHASRRAAEFYQQEERLATEHALLEDNGDGVGARAEIFEGTEPKAAAGSAPVDGARAGQLVLVLSEAEARLTEAQRARRDALERRLEALKAERAGKGDEAFFGELEPLLRELAEIYR
jgi:hypothetical protein